MPRGLGRDVSTAGLSQGEIHSLFERIDRGDMDLPLDLFGDLPQIGFVSGGEDDRGDTRPLCGEDLGPDPSHGQDLPLKVNSPVRAMSLRHGRFVSSDMRATAMVTPADGPSFRMAPAGTWM